MSPWAPKKPCATQGCPALLEPGRARCPAHTREAEKIYENGRPPGLREFYNSTAWKRFRAMIRAERIVCQCADALCSCRRWAPCTQPGVVVDHHVPPHQDWSKALDPENVSLLCVSCHNSKTARRQSWHRA